MAKYNAIDTHSEVCYWARLYGATGKSCRLRDRPGGVATSLTWGAASGEGIATRSHAGFPPSHCRGEICGQLFLKLWVGLRAAKYILRDWFGHHIGVDFDILRERGCL